MIKRTRRRKWSRAREEALEKAEAENAAAKQEDSSKAKIENGTQDKETTEQTEEVIAPGQYPIMGKSFVTVEQRVKYFVNGLIA